MNLYKRLFAWMLYKFSGPYGRLVEDRKRRLFEGLRGTIVEIGPGTGSNLGFLDKDVLWIGIEPNKYMHPYIRREADRLGMNNIEIKRLNAASLPFPDNSVDTVIGTLVLCTVPNQRVALSEILRILKPGGRFVFMEHVAAPRGSSMRRFQGLIKPVWMVLADGCRPDRETLKAIKEIGFSEVKSERFKIYDTFVSPHIAGVARK